MPVVFLLLHDVELDAVHESVVGDRTGMGSSCPKRLSVTLSGQADVFVADRGKGKQFDGIDLDDDARGAVTASGLDLRPTPQPDRNCEVALRYGLAKFPTEDHPSNLRPRLLSRVGVIRLEVRDAGTCTVDLLRVFNAVRGWSPRSRTPVQEQRTRGASMGVPTAVVNTQSHSNHSSAA